MPGHITIISSEINLFVTVVPVKGYKPMQLNM